MTDDPLFSARAKLDWARAGLERLDDGFRDWVKPGGGDDRPLGVRFHFDGRKTITAMFIAEDELPIQLSLRAGDVIHNTRVALDHTVAALKRKLGGNPRRGGFPTYTMPKQWDDNIDDGDDDPLQKLAPEAKAMIRAHQPFCTAPEGGDPEGEPLKILNVLDNRDKHRTISLAYIYPAVDKGIQLVEVIDRKRCVGALNLWNLGDPLVDGTRLARYTFLSPVATRTQAEKLLHVVPEHQVRATIGEIGRARTSFTEMIDRVRLVIDDAQQLLDQE